MKAGSLREQVRFQQRANVGDGYGNQQGAWGDVGQPHAARIRPLRGGEKVLADRLSGVQSFEISVRACPALAVVTPGWRIVDVRNPSRIFNIRSLQNPDERGRELLFMCDTGEAT